MDACVDSTQVDAGFVDIFPFLSFFCRVEYGFAPGFRGSTTIHMYICVQVFSVNDILFFSLFFSDDGLFEKVGDGFEVDVDVDVGVFDFF